MATTADFCPGLYIAFKQDVYRILTFQHVKPGKGGAFVRTKLKSVTTHKVIKNTFKARSKIQTIRVEKRPCQLLYQDSDYLHLMHQETFETHAIAKQDIPWAHLLKEGTSIHVLFRTDTGAPLGCEPPSSFLLRVTDTETGNKGNTANKAMKHATLETSATIQVPLFIKQGDLIKVDTATCTYLGKAGEDE